MAKIPQHFIDQVLERTDIVTLIGRRLSLKRAGTEYSALCPFHDEKTPSFTVAPKKQFYYCFGCGATGSAISFIMDYDRLEFRDAIELLAGEAGLEMPADSDAPGDDGPPLDPLYDALVFADRFYRSALRRSPAVIDYLKERGVSGTIAQRFGLGFAPDGGQQLCREIQDSATATRAGLLIERDNGGHFDRFRNRLMFPIRDSRGRPIAFGGRTLGDDKAKYLNSPETPLFHKSNQMYGLYEARQALRDIPFFLVVEGYMDVVALAQHGFDNAVATLGTATTEAHLKLLFRYTEEVVFCFDGDEAGRRAADKGLERCLPVLRGTRRVRFLFLPAGEDPDTLVRSDTGKQMLEQAIDDARSASDVLIERLTAGVNLDAADGRAQLVERGRAYAAALPHDSFRTELVAEIADLARLPVDDLRSIYNQAGQTNYRPTPEANSRTDNATNVRTPALTRALTRLLADPALAENVADIQPLRASPIRGVELLIDAIEFFRDNPTSSVATWLERQRDQSYFERLQQLIAQAVPGSREHRASEFDASIQRLQANDASLDSTRNQYQALLAQQASGPLDTAAARELNELAARLRSQPR